MVTGASTTSPQRDGWSGSSPTPISRRTTPSRPPSPTGAHPVGDHGRGPTGGAGPARCITRFLTSAYDALYVRAARDGEAALGPAPCPYALLVLGSGARRESTLRTDQDHALVVADGPPPGADGWFAALAEHLAATLERCGLVRCPARHHGHQPGLADAAAGLAGAVHPLDRAAGGGRGAPGGHLLRLPAGPRRARRRGAAAADRRPGRRQPAVPRPAGRGGPARGHPSAFLGHLRGEHHAGSTSRPTASPRSSTWPVRLEAGSRTPRRPPAGAADHGTAGTTAADLAAAFEYLQQVRLRHQAAAWPREPPGRRRPPRRAHRAPAPLAQGRPAPGHTCQESVRIAYRTDLIG